MIDRLKLTRRTVLAAAANWPAHAGAKMSFT
jgi:hypothetical protein